MWCVNIMTWSVQLKSLCGGVCTCEALLGKGPHLKSAGKEELDWLTVRNAVKIQWNNKPLRFLWGLVCWRLAGCCCCCWLRWMKFAGGGRSARRCSIWEENLQLLNSTPRSSGNRHTHLTVANIFQECRGLVDKQNDGIYAKCLITHVKQTLECRNPIKPAHAVFMSSKKLP